MTNIYNCFAIRALIFADRLTIIFKLKNVSLFFLKAFGAKPVIWLGRSIIFFVRVHKRLTSNFLKFILTLCLRPLFKLQYLLFEIVFDLQQVLMLRLHRQSIALYGEQYTKQFGSSFSHLIVNIDRCKALCDINRSLGRRNK